MTAPHVIALPFQGEVWTSLLAIDVPRLRL